MNRSGRGDRGWRRVLGAVVIALLSGCGAPDLLDPTEEPLAADRALLVSRIADGLTAAADQLGAGDALATRVDTGCAEGTDNWKVHDPFRSICELSVSSGFPLDVDLDTAFGGIDGLLVFEERMAGEGWGSADWHLVGDDPGVGVRVEEIRESGRPVTDVTGVRLWSDAGDGTSINLGFVPAATPVEPARDGPPGGYYGDTQGEDWQEFWAAERDEHVLLVVGRGDAVLAEQPW